MAWTATRLTRRLGIEYPIVQAPMSGSTPPALVAAVSNAGGLGSLGAPRLAPDELRTAIREIRSLTDRPFGVNLFVWRDPAVPAPEAVAKVRDVLMPHREAVGVPDDAIGPAPPALEALLDAQLEVVCDERVPFFSFTLGIPPLDAIRESGALIAGTATTVAEARALEQAGVDAVVVQGAEAGGHRGTFLGPFEEALVGTVALVPQAVDAVDVPVIAAGGIMDGRGIAAALALGAEAAQLGTAFLTCRESSAHPLQKRLVAEAPDTGTLVTDRYTGRPARAVRTRLLDDLAAAAPLSFPVHGAHTQPVVEAALGRGDADRTVVLAGQGAPLSRDLGAAELVAALVRETDAAVQRMST